MCGIAGIIHFDPENPVSQTLLDSMRDALAHRGPDGQGSFVERNIGLAHRRLSIIDLATGAQPLCNEDETVWIVYNGEVYNYRELRKELTEKGHRFKTKTDTETLVHLYEEHGPAFVERLNGMFAFALYDKQRKRLLLGRDRLGQKPLFYFQMKGGFAFGSELQALKKHPDMPQSLDLQSIHDYFSLQYVPSPKTIYRGVRKVPPAHILELDVAKGKFGVRRYWNLDFSIKRTIGMPQAREQVAELLSLSVKRRMVSDVPLGAFLSGGVDSSIIVGLMASCCPMAVRTFTVGFMENKYDERRYAHLAAHHLSDFAHHPVEHSESILQPVEFDVVEKLVDHFGEPYSDASMLPTYMLSKYTAEHVKVALSGDGADELFAGYYRYLVMRFAKYLDFLPLAFRKRLYTTLSRRLPNIEERTMSARVLRILRVLSYPPNERYLGIINRCDEELKRSFYGERMRDFNNHSTQAIMNALNSIATAKSPVEKTMEMDLHSYLPCDILTKVDIASMANSLEVRNPYLDHELVEFAASLPLNLKQNISQRKAVLKEAFREMLPKTICNREKMGFGVPLAKWFRGRWDRPLRDHLLAGKAIELGFIDKMAVDRLIREHQKMRGDYSYALWALLIFELFLKNN